jgi:hypothetical protein
MGATIPFLGFSPSADPTVPGAVLDCSNMIPTQRGMKAAPSPVPFGNPAFPSQVTGGATCELLSGVYRTIVGTGPKLYEVVGSANNDLSAFAYTGGLNKWRFAQFGNATLAVNGSDPIQQSVSAGAFASIAGSPVASIIEVVQGFVFLFDTTDSTNGHRPNGWSCSGLYDQTNWTPAQSTQCANGINIDQPGGFTAARALGTNIIAFKRESMFYGVYQGPPVIWAFNQISPQIGTPSQECVVSVGTSLAFLGTDYQVYVFDGTVPRPVGDDVREWLGANWSSTYQGNVWSYHDQPNNIIYWYFCSKNSTDGIPDKCLVYNYKVGKFGRADNRIECALQVISGVITWDGLGSLPGVSTWDTLPAIPYNSPYWASSSLLPSIVNSSHLLNSLSGVSLNSSLTSNWFGDDLSYSYVSKIVPRFKKRPTSCSGVARTQSILDADNASGQTIILPQIYDGEIPCDFSTRWAQITLNFTGDHEILGAVPALLDAGAI